MLMMTEPDVALLVAQHPVWLHSNLEALVEPGKINVEKIFRDDDDHKNVRCSSFYLED